jgi:O-antigen/teichoic acid export membrane protein
MFIFIRRKHMKKKFLTNIFLIIAVNLLIKPFWILGVDRAVQNSVGIEQYGIYSNLFTFSLLFIMLLDFGINSFSTSSIAKDHSIINKQFSSLVPLKLFFSVAYIIVTFGVGFVYGFTKQELWLLFVMSCNQVLALFIIYFRSNISGLQLFKTDSLLSVVDRSMMIIFCSLIIWSSVVEVTIQHFVYAQTLGYSTALMISFYVLKPHLSVIKLNFNKAILLGLIKQAYPYATLAILMTLYMRLDIILIKKVLPNGDYENGIYAEANRLLEASNMLAVMVGGMLLPMFAKMLNQKDELQQMVKMSMAILIAPAIMLAVFCSVYKYEIMTLLYTHSSGYSSDVFGVAIFSFIPMCVMYIFGTLLTANASMKVLSIIALAATIINISLNALLIPAKGAYGAAISAVCTHSFVALFNFIYARKILNLYITYTNALQFVFFALVYVSLILFIYQSHVNMFVSAFIGGVVGIMLLFVFRILSYRTVMQFVSTNLKRR